ncbi:hypothetical protein ACGFIR_28010 [Micromonospora sp. NPDC049051]|uniref:hypothetical protein n=1 Tax=Micromonospora sp. NPDC049051 TaxID=3364264 RepID=UPI0037106D71
MINVTKVPFAVGSVPSSDRLGAAPDEPGAAADEPGAASVVKASAAAADRTTARRRRDRTGMAGMDPSTGTKGVATHRRSVRPS